MRLHFSISNGDVVASLYDQEEKIVLSQQYKIQNLCENISNLFNDIGDFLLKNNQFMLFDEQHIFFDFDKQKNITTARIILSFITGLNIKKQ